MTPAPWRSEGGDGWHDELSARLDGELDGPASAALDARLAEERRLADELRWVAEARSAVRSLPPVDPSVGWDGLVAAVGRSVERDDRRRRRGTTMAVVGVAAAWLVAVVGWQAPPRDGGPALAGVFDTGGERSDAPPVTAMGSLPDQFVVPSRLGPGADVELQDVRRRDHEVEAVYADDGGPVVTVVQRPGRIDFDRLPTEGRQVVVGDLDAWQLVTPERSVLVVQRGDMIHVFVADHGMHLDTLAAGLPEPAPVEHSWWEHTRRAVGDTVTLLNGG